jgi:hypothetical protein
MAAVRSKLEAKNSSFHASDFPLQGLAAHLVDHDAYDKAVGFGEGAVPDFAHDLTGTIASVWVGHVRKYAAEVPDRMAERLAEVTTQAEQELESVPDILDRVAEQLDNLRYSVTRYAEPVWGAGQNAYGVSLDISGVKLQWTLGDADNCADCPALADQGPYDQTDIPTWPKMGDTACRDNCYCTITADATTWAEAFD